jgi:hypothetical protein
MSMKVVMLPVEGLYIRILAVPCSAIINLVLSPGGEQR